MSSSSRSAPRVIALLMTAGLIILPTGLVAWQAEPAATTPAGQGTAKETKETKEQEVTIDREALQLTAPQKFRQHLVLTPVKTLEVPAPADGYVRSMLAKLAAKMGKESELLRLDDSRASLVLKAAKARLAAANVEKKLAKESDQQALAEAHIEAAKSEVELAQLDLDRLVIRAPFAGEIHEVHVVEGQFVRAGQPLLTLADVTQLRVEVPVDSTAAKAGGDIDLKVNETATKGKIQVLLPLARRFEALRDLSDNLQTAVVSLENANTRLAAGQSVYCDVIPLEPVAPVATTAVRNQKDGTRKVQVIRNNTVRDIAVRIHSKIGTERVYVSGMFREGDELIKTSSVELADGTPLREYLQTAAADKAGPKKGETKSARPMPSDGGF